MFKDIEINLTEPICSCETQNLSWGIYCYDDNKVGLQIICRSCNTELKIPQEKFVACFNLEKEYPKGHAKKDDKQEKENKEKERADEVSEDEKFLRSIKIEPNSRAE